MVSLLKLRALATFLAGRGPARAVPRRWLLRTPTRLFREWERTHRLLVSQEDDFTIARLDGTPFVWPASAALAPLPALLAELTIPDHPHQYDYGHTPLTSQDVLLDIGCCEGGFAAQAAERGAEVIVVEPSRTMRRVIERLFLLRSLPPPHIVPALLGARAGNAFFQEHPQDPACSRITSEEERGAYSVPITTLDQLAGSLPRPPTFLKCDAEGADFDILQGGRDFLRACRPKIAITTYHHSEDFDRMREFLRSLGYKNLAAKGLIFYGHELRPMLLHAA